MRWISAQSQQYAGTFWERSDMVWRPEATLSESRSFRFLRSIEQRKRKGSGPRNPSANKEQKITSSMQLSRELQDSARKALQSNKLTE